MTRKEALKLAISNEIKAQNFYKLLADSMKNEESKKTFAKLTPMEKMHEEKLTDLFNAEFPNEDLDIAKDLLPSFDQNAVPTEPVEILKFAIVQEDNAEELYKKLASESSNEEIKKLFIELAEDEKNHHVYIQAEIDRMFGLNDWFDLSQLEAMI